MIHSHICEFIVLLCCTRFLFYFRPVYIHHGIFALLIFYGYFASFCVYVFYTRARDSLKHRALWPAHVALSASASRRPRRHRVRHTKCRPTCGDHIICARISALQAYSTSQVLANQRTLVGQCVAPHSPYHRLHWHICTAYYNMFQHARRWAPKHGGHQTDRSGPHKTRHVCFVYHKYHHSYICLRLYTLMRVYSLYIGTPYTICVCYAALSLLYDVITCDRHATPSLLYLRNGNISTSLTYKAINLLMLARRLVLTLRWRRSCAR